jgi:hypothetical protein
LRNAASARPIALAIPACTAEAGSGTDDAETVQVPEIAFEIPLLTPNIVKPLLISKKPFGARDWSFPALMAGPVESNGMTSWEAVKAPEKPFGKSAGSIIWTPSMSGKLSVVHDEVGEAGGDEMVIVAPISPGFGAPVPSVNPYVTEPAWQGKLAGASYRATITIATAK